MNYPLYPPCLTDVRVAGTFFFKQLFAWIPLPNCSAVIVAPALKFPGTLPTIVASSLQNLSEIPTCSRAKSSRLVIFFHQYCVFPKIVGFPPKSSILIGISIINHPFWGTTIFGNTHIVSANFDQIFHSLVF